VGERERGASGSRSRRSPPVDEVGVVTLPGAVVTVAGVLPAPAGAADDV